MKKLSAIALTLSFFLVTAPNTFAQIVITPAAGMVIPGTSSINRAISFAIGLLFAVAILGAIGFLIWGGIKWITSGGDKTKVDSARGTIVASIIGLIIVLLTFVILNFVVQLFNFGANIFSICIPTLSGNQPCVQ